MRQDQVYRQLGKVYDPELDQPLTELGFIGGVSVAGGTVTVQFRLPTYWCAANFAFLMAADIRARVSELPWVSRVEVRLADHFCDSEINTGVNAGQSFRQTFPDLATEELDGLRETFRVKAHLTRQERLLRRLMELGWPEADLIRLRVGELERLAAERGEAAGPAERYLEIMRERGLPMSPDAPALVHPDGQPVAPGELAAHLAHCSRTRLAMEFNGSLCRGLLKTRYGEDVVAVVPLSGLES